MPLDVDVCQHPAHLTSPHPCALAVGQWLVLGLASAGWVFDVFEGQILGMVAILLLPETKDQPLPE
jgi:hypothetical protein